MTKFSWKKSSTSIPLSSDMFCFRASLIIFTCCFQANFSACFMCFLEGFCIESVVNFTRQSHTYLFSFENLRKTRNSLLLKVTTFQNFVRILQIFFMHQIYFQMSHKNLINASNTYFHCQVFHLETMNSISSIIGINIICIVIKQSLWTLILKIAVYLFSSWK